MVDLACGMVAVGQILGRNLLSLHFEERYSEQQVGLPNLGELAKMRI